MIKLLHDPIVLEVAEKVNTAYENILPGLPYPELPVISVTGALCSSMPIIGPEIFSVDTAAGSVLLNQITANIASSENEELFEESTSLTSHLHASDCLNIAVAMKALIGGFLAKSPGCKQWNFSCLPEYSS